MANGKAGRPNGFKAQDFIKAIPGTGGVISVISDRVGCHWHTAKKYIVDYPTVNQAYENEKHKVDDKAVSNVYLAINDYGVEVWHTGGFDWSALKDQNDDYWYTIVDGADLSSTVLNALEKSEGDLWVATAGGLVKRTENGTIIEYTSSIIGEERKILNNDVHDIEKDRFGNLWVATSGGLNIVDQGGTVKGIYTTYDYWKANLLIIVRLITRLGWTRAPLPSK